MTFSFFCIIYNYGPSVHLGLNSTDFTPRDHFFWSKLLDDVRILDYYFIHLLDTTTGGTVPIPFFPAVHGTKPNDLVQFDYLQIAPFTTGENMSWRFVTNIWATLGYFTFQTLRPKTLHTLSSTGALGLLSENFLCRKVPPTSIKILYYWSRNYWRSPIISPFRILLVVTKQ